MTESPAGQDDAIEARDRGMGPLVRHARAHRDHRPPGDADRRRHRCRRGPPTPRTDERARAVRRLREPGRRGSVLLDRPGSSSQDGRRQPAGPLSLGADQRHRRLRGPRHRGSARWFSAIVQRSPAARLAGAPPFGDALFLPDLGWMPMVASSSSSPPRGTDRTGCEPTSTRRRCSCGSSSVRPTMWSSWSWRSRTSPVVPRCRRCSPSTTRSPASIGDSHVRVAPPPVPGRDPREGGLDQRLHNRCRCADERRGRSAGRQRGGRPVAHRAGRSADRHGRTAAAVRVLGRPGGQRLDESFDYQHVFSGFTCATRTSMTTVRSPSSSPIAIRAPRTGWRPPAIARATSRCGTSCRRATCRSPRRVSSRSARSRRSPASRR